MMAKREANAAGLGLDWNAYELRRQIDILTKERDEARALVIRALHPHNQDSWRQWMEDAEALTWTEEAK